MPAGNSFGTLEQFVLSSGKAHIHSLPALERQGLGNISSLPFTIKVLLEAVLRQENQTDITREHVQLLADYQAGDPALKEIPFMPARVLVQDFTGVPAMVDLAAMRSAMARLGGDPARVNPQVPVDLVIDHSVQVDTFGSPDALQQNADAEFLRNRERYEFLHWAQKSFANLRVVPPASGICHQLNLEYFGEVVRSSPFNAEGPMLLPDSLVGLDSHTTMINGLGILGWGVGGIEAEAVMLGQPVSMLQPQVVGFKLSGSLPPESTATDLALTVTQILRQRGVVGKFVEFYGSGLSGLSLPDRATISNMAPEQGATCCFFPVDAVTLNYLEKSGRDPGQIDLVERYCKEQGLFRTDQTNEPEFSDLLDLDLSSVVPSLAGPKRPQDRIPVAELKSKAAKIFPAPAEAELTHGSVVIAAITSCTNTSNPSVMLGAGLLAKKAVLAGLSVKSSVKASLAPGSKVVTRYLEDSGLLEYLEQLGFHLVGYGCTTCIGNSGPLPEEIDRAITEGDLVVASVLSGNRNFEGRIHQRIKANFLASPPLVVAYALAGTMNIDLTREPVGLGSKGQPVFLKDIWPDRDEVDALLPKATDPERFHQVYERLLTENESWNAIGASSQEIYDWNQHSTYIQEPPFFMDLSTEPQPVKSIKQARILLLLGDSVTTDHISPAGAFPADSEAGRYLTEQGLAPKEFNSYGSRRGNDRVMTRGTFANIRIRNQLGQGREGGFTTHLPSNELLTIYQAAQRYQQEGVACVVIAGKDYGMGSSRDWAAKGTQLLGIKAVLAASFERIHRSNLIGMGVLPLQYSGSLDLTGQELIDIPLSDDLQPGQEIPIKIGNHTVPTRCRIDTPVELEYFKNGGILHTVLRKMLEPGWG